MSIKQHLDTEEYGVFVLKADDEEYVCASVRLEWGINAIPSARVTLGFGASIRQPSSIQRPDKLLGKVLATRKQDAYQGMIECEISEVFEDGRSKQVFSGVIVTGSPVYSANEKFSSKMVSLLCLNKICRLYASPLAAYVIAHSSKVINHMASMGVKLSADEAQNDQTFQKLIDINKLVEDVKQQSKDGNVLPIVDGILQEYLAKSSFRPDTGNDLGGATIKLSDYLFSRIRVNPALDSLEKSYYQQIGNYLVSGLNNSSIYDTLQRMLITDEFMLNLIPRFTKVGSVEFPVELVPSYMWNPKVAFKLDRSQLTSVSASFNPIACLNTPQVLMVTFDPLNDIGNTNTQQSLAYYGIYSTDDSLMERLKAARGKGGGVKPAADGFFRCVTLQAPHWLYPLSRQPDTNQSKGGDGEVSKETKNKTGQGKPTSVNKPEPRPKDELWEHADQVAQALFAHKYGRQDTASLRVPAGLRFGYNDGLFFEDHLGDAIDVRISEGQESDAFDFRGILQSVSFSYVTGIQSSVDYAMELSCVRPLDNDEKKIDCVIYQELK